MVKRKVRKKENIYDDSWIYILLLTTLTILLESLKIYTFTIKGVSLTYSLLMLPFVYYIVDYITKKYSSKKAMTAIIASGISFVAFTAIMSFALGEIIIISNVSGEFCAYLISQFINLSIYNFIINNTKSPYLIILLNYMFSLIIYYMIYTLIYLNTLTFDTYWLGYFITLGIQFIICIPIAYFDKKTSKKRKQT